MPRRSIKRTVLRSTKLSKRRQKLSRNARKSRKHRSNKKRYNKTRKNTIRSNKRSRSIRRKLSGKRRVNGKYKGEGGARTKPTARKGTNPKVLQAQAKLEEKREEMDIGIKRLEVGIKKLTETNAMVEGMQQELNALQPELLKQRDYRTAPPQRGRQRRGRAKEGRRRGRACRRAERVQQVDGRPAPCRGRRDGSADHDGG